MQLESPSFLDLPNSCIVDSATSHTILRDRAYFQTITPSKRQVTTIMGRYQLEEGYGPATLILPQGTKIHIKSAIYAPKATWNLLSFRDIRENNLHIHIGIQDSTEVLNIMEQTPTGMALRETMTALPLGFYATTTHTYHTQAMSPSATEVWDK
ncbi:unnamed protein product [Calypogeia fissa]